MSLNSVMSIRWLAGAALLAAAALLYGQSSRRQQEVVRGPQFWKCTMPGGTYVAALDRISSVSTHEFLVQGAGRVWEMAIGDDSAVTARFYYMEPATSLAGVKDADQAYRDAEKELDSLVKDAGGTSPWRQVVKLFPQTTHAHSVEYRVPDRETLNRIFDHLTSCWTGGRAGSLNLTDGSGN